MIIKPQTILVANLMVTDFFFVNPREAAIYQLELVLLVLLEEMTKPHYQYHIESVYGRFRLAWLSPNGVFWNRMCIGTLFVNVPFRFVKTFTMWSLYNATANLYKYVYIYIYFFL